MAIDAALFDHDDTLVHTFPFRARSWQEAVRDVLGRHIDGAGLLRRHMGETIERTALREAGGDEATAARLVARYRAIYYAAADGALAAFPGIAETLAALRAAGVRIAVVTSKIRAGAEQELAQCGLAPLVDTLVASDDVVHHKPHPESVLRALDLLGASAGRAVMVGDTPADLHAAEAAGVRGAAALWGALDRTALRDLRPAYLWEWPADALEIVGKARGR